jgi:hypothetical protein
MAFVAGDRVRVKLSTVGSLAPGTLQPQPPLVGVVTAAAPGVNDVTFSGQEALTGVPDAALDKITDTASPIQLAVFLDKVVVGIAVPATATKPLVPYSDAYIGRVVDVYDVNAPGSTKVLIRSLSNGMYYELPFPSVHPLEDR